jgi:peptide/nickel transport system substrate-binding protein
VKRADVCDRQPAVTLPTQTGTSPQLKSIKGQGTLMPTAVFRPRTATCLGIIAATVILTGCTASPDRPTVAKDQELLAIPIGTHELEQGGILNVALAADPDQLDPTTTVSLQTGIVLNSICEKLYDLDESGEPTPQLAASLPVVSPDGLSMQIDVRPGVRFADGTPLDAAATATSIERHLTLPASARKAELGSLIDVRALDSDTVELQFAESFAPIVGALSDRAGMIMSPTQLTKLGEDFGTAPVCVGPMKFAKRTAQTSIEVERDDNYYAADEVHLDGISYKIITDANIRATNLESGDVQIADAVSPNDADRIAANDDLTLMQASSLGYWGVSFNIANGTPDTPLAEDRRVREAFAMSIDRNALASAVFRDWYDPACSPISPASPYSSEASEVCPPFDPEAARTLLEDAGVGIPYAFSLLVPNEKDSLRYAQALQASVAEGGFDVTIEPVELSTLFQVIGEGEFDSMLLNWSGRVDPHSNIANFLTSSSPSNTLGYANAELDDLVMRAAASTDREERVELYGEITRVLQEDYPTVYVYRPRVLTGVSNNIVGVKVYSNAIEQVAKAAYVKDGR